MSSGPVRLTPIAGKNLRDQLFEMGVEFPCGGVSQCGGCKVRVLEGDVPITPAMRAVFTHADLAAGWRLGCEVESHAPVTLEIAQWSAQILDDQAQVPFEPAEGRGAVVDIGTTTLVAQIVDLTNGEVVAVETSLNPQARHGADLMSRVQFDLANPGILTKLIREFVGQMLTRLAGEELLREVLLVGNTAMHHLFCGLSVEPLAAVPFRPNSLEAQHFSSHELGWSVDVNDSVCFLPCVGGFVGSDLLAGVIVVGLHESEEPGALMDLGTNGEIAIGSKAGIQCASTAAGPAFEGGRIGMGMRAGAGAIDIVHWENERLACSVLGGGPARGLCGSGLVDAVAVALDQGWVGPNGRFTNGRKAIALEPPVSLSQADIRELQLAKGAIAAGFHLLLGEQNLESERIHLAGAFGNYIKAASARRIGLLPAWAKHPVAAGNTALRGARMLLLTHARRESVLASALSRCEHVELAASPRFQDAFVDAMGFPG